MSVQLRISKISIEIPNLGDEIWVRLSIQKVEWNEEKTQILNVVPRADFVYRKASTTVTEINTIFDPVLQNEVTLSGYGLHLAIEKMGMVWVNQELGGTFDEAGKLWVS